METQKIESIKLHLLNLLESHRVHNGFTSSEMAKTCGISPARYSAVTSGTFKKVTIDNLIRLNLRANTGFKIIDIGRI